MTHKIELKSPLLTKNLTYKVNCKQQKTLKKGFSLLELLVVILILGILAAAVVPNVIEAGDKAKEDLTCVNMATAKRTLDMFKLDNGIYPETEEGFNALMSNPDTDKYVNYNSNAYLKVFPKDAWGGKMIYIKKGNDFDIASYGADRKEGGTDYSSDLKLSNCKK
jgi:general secretion pathway protein G